MGSSAAAPTSDFVPLSTPALLEQESQEVSASQALRSRLDKIFLEDHVYRLGATGDKTRDKVCVFCPLLIAVASLNSKTCDPICLWPYFCSALAPPADPGVAFGSFEDP